MQPDFISMDINKIKNLNTIVKDLCNTCEKFGLICPTIRINSNQTILKYDCDNRYVYFTINNIINFTYGTIEKKSIVGTLKDIDKQLKILSKFLYQESK
jgi:hypothetical protein